MIGCMIAPPAATPTVVIRSAAYLKLNPRNAEPRATSISPPTNAAVAPKRATSSDPANAAIANNAGGMLLRRPTSVALKSKSSRIIAMTGGTARMVSLSPFPASHSRATAIHFSRLEVCVSSGMDDTVHGGYYHRLMNSRLRYQRTLETCCGALSLIAWPWLRSPYPLIRTSTPREQQYGEPLGRRALRL